MKKGMFMFKTCLTATIMFGVSNVFGEAANFKITGGDFVLRVN